MGRRHAVSVCLAHGVEGETISNLTTVRESNQRLTANLVDNAVLEQLILMPMHVCQNDN